MNTADQVNLAGIQLSLLNMGSQVTTINQTQAMEFVVSGSLSSMKIVSLIIRQWFVVCRVKQMNVLIGSD
jgi:hypothetical protein